MTVLLTGAAQVLLKLGVSAPYVQEVMAGGVWGRTLLACASSPSVLAGLILYGLCTLSWLIILSRVELSLAYPFVALGFIETSILGYLLFGDNMTAGRFCGTLLVIAGVYLVARS